MHNNFVCIGTLYALYHSFIVFIDGNYCIFYFLILCDNNNNVNVMKYYM